MNFVEHQAVKFIRKSHIRKCSLSKLLFICHKNGYIVKNYSNGKNFMLAAGIWRKAQAVPSISIVDEYGGVLIFIKDGLSADKRSFALAHELGHITLKHNNPENEEAENEANEFAHLLLDGWALRSAERRLPIIVFVLCFIVILSFNIKPTINDNMVYYTRYGEVYHLYKECYYLKNSNKIYSGTIENSCKDRCCSACEYNKIHKE